MEGSTDCIGGGGGGGDCDSSARLLLLFGGHPPFEWCCCCGWRFPTRSTWSVAYSPRYTWRHRSPTSKQRLDF